VLPTGDAIPDCVSFIVVFNVQRYRGYNCPL
jgi:hypothetical protein